MRGLKPNRRRAITYLVLSHLLQMRGLKQITGNVLHNRKHVASFTDAWIETPVTQSQNCCIPCRIFYRCVDWNSQWNHGALQCQGRIFYRCVDWNNMKSWLRLQKTSHLLQMRGLKLNLLRYWQPKKHRKSHLLQMRGLKLNGKKTYNRFISRIFYRCVDWNKITLISINITKSRIFYRCVDWNLCRWR